MVHLSQWELGIPQGTLIARRRARERRAREMMREGGEKMRYEGESVGVDGPREIYNMKVGTVNGHNFEGYVFYQGGYFCVVCCLDGQEVARREDLWSLEVASIRLRIELERVLKQIEEWAQMPVFGLK